MSIMEKQREQFATLFKKHVEMRDRVVKFLAENRYDITVIAELVGTSRQTIYNLLNRITQPSAKETDEHLKKKAKKKSGKITSRILGSRNGEGGGKIV